MIKYKPVELLSAAIMNRVPCIIVEGADDIRIYEKIAASANIECLIFWVEMLEDRAGGCDGVIEAMKTVESVDMPYGKSVNQFMMGVIDRDTRYYRKMMPTLTSIFVLNTYSIESSFVSKSVINFSVDQWTKNSSREKIDTQLIYSNVERNILDLYYFSLDALRRAVDPNYNSIVSFSDNPGRRKDGKTLRELQSRKVDLDIFAATLSLTSDIESLKKFVKGKWLLTAYSEELVKEIEQLSNKCKSSKIQQCCVCKVNNSGACLYKVKSGLTKNSLYSTLMEFVNIPDFEYIRDAFKDLATTAAT